MTIKLNMRQYLFKVNHGFGLTLLLELLLKTQATCSQLLNLLTRGEL